VGGFIGPTVIGAMKDRFGTHSAAFMLLGTFAGIAALLALGLQRVAVLRCVQASELVGELKS
jgi:hypothetical protein